MPAEVADAHDEALLDMVAFEMAAPDPWDIDDPSGSEAADIDDGDIRVAEPPPAEPQTIAQAPEPAAASAMAAVVQPSPEPSLSQPSFERPAEPLLGPSLEPSLGSTLIANGIVRRRNALAADPLAPIRRMSQAEKIAFFS